MEGSYPVSFGNQKIGKVIVERQGLYYRFHCRCRLTGSGVCRLRVRCAEVQENIGILVPVDGGFGLETKLPVKRFGDGKPEFFLVPKHEHKTEIFAAVYPEEPFAYISRLKKAYLSRKDGQIGIVLK